ncbi:hypothetical protein AOQ84DRAFT_341008 [Glonium stellatum]|uniref:Inositolphosphotransferase Aur1/Ipt1 domain-containing protein n=1 Tax=Glonium stellatum TaxID=574774 RepID=A0A8E2F056_9PEZI|nr:hypothetical protein AOQ84DRAFT_341008 [Glonium stellatum]
MSIFKNVLEPILIALTFTVGAVVNRQRRRKRPEKLCGHAPLSDPIRDASSRGPNFLPDNTAFRLNITSRLLASFPFLIEIWYWLLTYWSYQLARAYSAYLIRDNETIRSLAQSHALFILTQEKRLGIDIEQHIQEYILCGFPWLMPVLAKIYHSHIIVGVVFIVYIYTFLPLPVFEKIRRTIAMDNLLAFVILTCWRCTPPRLLPREYGFIDVLHNGPQSAWTQNRFQLTIAAMPSLHFGTSAFIGVCLWRFTPHHWLRWLAPLWPLAMILTILATANHFVLDAVVGVAIPVLGWKANEILLLFRPLEEWCFWLCRTERPLPNNEPERPSNSDGKQDSWLV